MTLAVETGRMSAAQAAFFAREAPAMEAFAQQFSLDPGIVYLMAAQKGSVPESVRKRANQMRAEGQLALPT